MRPLQATSTAQLDEAGLRQISTLAGPCLTLLVPAFHPGTHELSPDQVIRSLVHTAAEQAASRRLVEAIPMLKRLEESSTRSAGHLVGSGAFAIFTSRGASARYEVAYSGPPRLVLASYPLERPFIKQSSLPTDAVILCLSRKRIRLFDYLAGHCHSRPLPVGTPETIGIADSDGESPSSPASDHQRSHLEYFFATVDHAIGPTLAGKLLLLAGVEEETSAYRRISSYARIAERDMTGNWDYASDTDLAKGALIGIEQQIEQEGRRIATQFVEKRDRGRCLTDAHEIVISAADGRVHQLVFASGSHAVGKLPPHLDLARSYEEDLVNAAIVETLRHGGKVWEVAGARPGGGQLEAILRF